MNTITLLRVINLRNETTDTLSIILEKPDGFIYQAGDCVDISFPDALHLGKQTYSFASSPHDSVLMLAFKRGYSQFKHTLEALKSGDILLVTQYGSNFIFNSKIPSIMIAGGIGITPLKSMIKTRLIEHPTISTILFFQNRTLDFPFYAELSRWQKKYPSLKIYWQDTDTKGRLTPEILTLIVGEKTDAFHYYVAGPPLMVDATSEILKVVRIDQTKIHTDSFDGYFEEI